MFSRVQAPTQEGLDGVERTRKIRRTATKKRAAFRNRGPGRAELAEPGPDPQQPATQWTPDNLVRAREYQVS